MRFDSPLVGLPIPSLAFALAALVPTVPGPGGAGPATAEASAPNDLLARGRRGAVVCADPAAARVGLQVLKDGGNAVDAAVATALTLAVVHPSAGNLGGGGFMLLRLADGRTTAINFREKAPAAATRGMYLTEDGSVHPDRSLLGATAAGVPGSPAGLLLALERYGTRPLAEMAAPAIRLADEGFEVDHFLAARLQGKRRTLGRFPSTKAVFFTDGRPLRAGERLVQKDLAATLRRFAEGGFDGFYRGETARLVAAQMKSLGGYITEADMAAYEAQEKAALRGTYRGYEIVGFPPPSSGGVAVQQMLNILEPWDLAGAGHGSARTIHWMVEAMRRAYADRSKWLGDPDFFDVPVEGLTSKAYADELRKGMRSDMLVDVGPGVPPGAPESDDTTHFSVVDAEGNAVSCTTTINSTFGSGLVADGLGFFWNNEMDDFSAKPGVPNQFGLVGGEANAIEPGKRMLSSMTPTMVLKDGKPLLVLGSPGGGRIINTVLQVILNVVDFGLPLREAVTAPRIHHQWLPDELQWERLAINPDTRARLEEMGHTFARRPRGIGRCQAIYVAPGGDITAAADPRSGGAAMAW